MKRKFILCWACALLAGCGGLALPVAIPVPVTEGPPAFILPLDGQWVLANDLGGRSCLVIQESRVSILNLTCSSDGSGFVSRIIEAPVISRAGDRISFSLRYNPRSFDSAEAELSFTGRSQLDGTFIGMRTDRPLGDDDQPTIVQTAILAHQ
jgi:hypothetical protein